MIIVQLKCTVICSQRLTVNIRLRLETPDRLCVCVSFLTSSCLILFLERIAETSRLSETSRGRTSSSSSTWFLVCESLWSLFLCMFSVCSSASVCVFLCIYVFIFPLELSDHVETVTNKKKRRKCFYESVLCSVAGRVLFLPRRYRQPLMTGSERQRNHSLYTLCLTNHRLRKLTQTTVNITVMLMWLNTTQTNNKTNIGCLFLSILGELVPDVVF